ncbi:hypothetical protein [Lacunimicrobium album]
MNTMSKTFTLKRFLVVGLLMGGLAFASTAAQAGGPHHSHSGGWGGGYGGGGHNHGGNHHGGHNHGGYGGGYGGGGYGGGYRPGWGGGHNHGHYHAPVRPYPVRGPVYYGAPAYRGNSIGFSNGNIGFIYNWR